MNKKGFTPILIVLIVASVLVAGGIWYYETHQSTAYQESPTVGISTTTQPTSEGTPSIQAMTTTGTDTSPQNTSKLQSLIADATTTSDWLTYTDPTYGFSFSYPKEFAICPTPSNNFSFEESVEEINLNAVSEGGCASNNIILIRVATPQSIVTEKQQSVVTGQNGGESVYFTPFDCENNMTVSCSLYTSFAESNTTKSFVFNGNDRKGKKLRIEFDAEFVSDGNKAFSEALNPYLNHMKGVLSISDSQFMNIAQSSGELEDVAFLQILNSIYSSFKK